VRKPGFFINPGFLKKINLHLPGFVRKEKPQIAVWRQSNLPGSFFYCTILLSEIRKFQWFLIQFARDR